MRYRFIDKLVSLALDGQLRIEVEKTFHGDGDVFSGPSGPTRVPDSLLLELMAMTGGYLIFRHLGGSRLPLLLKVPECRFEGSAGPEVALRAVAELKGISTISDDATNAEASAGVFAGADIVATGTPL